MKPSVREPNRVVDVIARDEIIVLSVRRYRRYEFEQSTTPPLMHKRGDAVQA
jgi:hypothetical protein